MLMPFVDVGKTNWRRGFLANAEYSLFTDNRESCSLNKVLYLKQDEIAVADSLGRVKLWDTRLRDKLNPALTFAM